MSRLYPERPIVGVGVAVCRGDSVLLVRRAKPPRLGEWSLPGGAQKVGETVFEAAAREIREETRLEIEVLGLVDVVDSIELDGKGLARYHYTLVDVYAAARSGDPVAGDDVSEVAWVPVRELGGRGLWSETRRVLEKGHALFLEKEKAQREGTISSIGRAT
nr:NUDIX hydrolase [uncultured bacterium]